MCIGNVVYLREKGGDYKTDFLLRYSFTAAKKDAAITSTITQVSNGQLLSGSSPMQGKGWANALIVPISNNMSTLAAVFNFIRRSIYFKDTDLFL